LGHRMIRPTADMTDAVVLEPVAKLTNFPRLKWVTLSRNG
jgi:hypothetical protein